MNVAFVWSKAMDEVDSDGTAIGYYLDRRRDYARAGFDRTKVFNVDYVYELSDFAKQNGSLKRVVNGWQLAGFTRFWDGTPLNVSANGDPGTLGGGQRAVYLGGQIYPDNPTRYNYFNPLVFGRPAQGTLGSMGRTPHRTGINQWTSRCTTLASRSACRHNPCRDVQYVQSHPVGRVNAGISVPNLPPVTASSQGSTGQVSSTRDPRNIQFGLKLISSFPPEQAAKLALHHSFLTAIISIYARAVVPEGVSGLLCAADALQPVFQKAVAALSSGNYPAAEAGFQQVLKTAPNHVGALGNLGVVYSRTSRPDKAIAVYQRALRIAPQDRGLMLNLGLTYIKQESFTDALPLFEKLAAADPFVRRYRTAY